MSNTSDKIQPGGKGRIQHLIRAAFKGAKEGDRVEAMYFWSQAIKEGYEAKVKTKRQLMFELRQADIQSAIRAAIEHGKEHGIKTGLPDGLITEKWENNTSHGLAARIIAARRLTPSE